MFTGITYLTVQYYYSYCILADMGRNRRNHDVQIKNILSYVQAHLGESLSLSAVARHAGQSISWLEAYFKRETGQSIGQHLMQMRMRKAKELLRATNLSITEIAFDAGFNSYTRFAIAFRKAAGVSPTQYRLAAQQLGEAPISFGKTGLQAKNLERFRDTFDGREIQACWKNEAGSWNQEKGVLTGKSDGEFTLSHTPALPENFALSFDFFFECNPHLRIQLHGVDRLHKYLEIAMGKFGSLGELVLANSDHGWIENVVVKSGEWQNIQIELIEDTVRLLLDQKLIGEHRDPFPPPFSSRSRFSIGGWGTTLACRNLTILDLGFMPLVRAVRQVDALYSNEMYDRAAEGYMRLLASTVDPREVAELQYKVGMCFLHQNSLTQARAWHIKIESSDETDFWFNLARQALLEADHLGQDDSAFIAKAANLFSDHKNRNAVRNSVDRARSDLLQGGFFVRALHRSRALFELETAGTFLSFQALGPLAEILFALRRYDEAIEALRKLAAAGACIKDGAAQAKTTLADVLSYAGKHLDSEETIQEIRTETQNHFLLARCDVFHAQNLCAHEKFHEAIAFLMETPTRYSSATDIAAFAMLRASQIYCQLGQVDAANRVISETQERFAENYLLRGYYGGYFRYPPFFAAGKHWEAAEILLESSKTAGAFHSNANQMILAGILFELANDETRAKNIWEEAGRRFPATRCCFYGPLADDLAQGRKINLEVMPYSALHRAEMFYLAGLLFRKRGHDAIAQEYFCLAVADDPTLNWFTWMAKKEMDR